MNLDTLTNRQREIYNVMVEYHRANGEPASIRQIGERLGIKSPNGTKCHIVALAKKGFAKKNHYHWIAIVPDMDSEAVDLLRRLVHDAIGDISAKDDAREFLERLDAVTPS